MAAPKLKQPNYVAMHYAAERLGVGRNGLFEFLRERNIFTADNLPYRKYIAKGYFHVEIKRLPRRPMYYQAYVTGDGIAFIRSLLIEHPEMAERIRRRDPAAKNTRRTCRCTQTGTKASAANH